MKGVFAFVTAVAVASPASAWVDGHHAGFLISAKIDNDDPHCTMFASFDNDTHLLVRLNASARNSLVAFTSNVTTSVEHGSDHILEIGFGRNGIYDDGWDDTKFTAIRNESASTTFFSQNLNQQFLDDVARSDFIAFYTDKEALIQSYKLSGSAVAIAALRRCAFEVDGLNPKDPFLK